MTLHTLALGGSRIRDRTTRASVTSQLIHVEVGALAAVIRGRDLIHEPLEPSAMGLTRPPPILVVVELVQHEPSQQLLIAFRKLPHPSDRVFQGLDHTSPCDDGSSGQHNPSVGDTGLERSHDSAGKLCPDRLRGTKCGTTEQVYPDLTAVIEAWHLLPAEIRAEIIRIIAQADATPRATP